MRHCNHCGRKVGSLHGYTKHEASCRRRLQKHAHRRQQAHVRFNTLTDGEPSANSQRTNDIDHPRVDVSIDSFDNGSYADDYASDSTEVVAGRQTVALAGRASTSSSLRIETFQDIEGREVGQPVEDLSCMLQPGTTAESLHYPFVGDTDFAIASWFLRAKLSKGQINDFLHEPALASIRDHISFGNHDELVRLIHAIPHGIPDDKWHERKILVENSIVDISASEYTVRYRCVMDVIRFLLGHIPFKDHLSYAPIRRFTTDEAATRVYDEMHTGDWWWDMQLRLGDNATIVPLLIGTDKTVLTQHHGDESAWPVYLTIGNLDRETRRKQTSTGTILLGFIPELTGVRDKAADKADGIKSRVYHTSMRYMLEPLEGLSQTGVNVRCADGNVRCCYPIIAGIMADYEEQVLITGIKSGRHCATCQVPPDEREHLVNAWPKRTHDTTRQQIAKQRRVRIESSHDSWIHDVGNFAWYHPHTNIHEAMMVDILHQLLKGIVMYMIEWVKEAINNSIVGVRKRKGSKRSLKESAGAIQLDDRFRAVPSFPSLKRFQRFSDVKQWTGVEQKAMVRQIVPVIAPLLTKAAPDVMHFVRAVVDFCILAQYRSHTGRTLGYMDSALYRINKFKEYFRDGRPVDKDTDQGHFNFPKFHSMVHYVEHIRTYGSADGFDTAHFESCHKYLLKAFYDRTNKSNSYQTQILHHNTRHTNILAMSDTLLYQQTSTTSCGNQTIQTEVTTTSNPVNLTKQGCILRNRESIIRCGSITRWRTASDLVGFVGVDGFVDALAVFVRDNRSMISNTKLSNLTLDRRDRDPSWVQDFPVCLHPSLKCWHRDGKDARDIEMLVSSKVRCSPNWQRGNDWRRDYVWVQEYDIQEGKPWEGRLVGQLLTTVTVRDEAMCGDDGKPREYTGALVEVLRFRNHGKPHPVHGMVELEVWPVSTSRNARSLGGRRFYSMSTVLRSAHVVPSGTGFYYLNNYIDWDQYNTIYNEDFERTEKAAADEFFTRYSKRQMNP